MVEKLHNRILKKRLQKRLAKLNKQRKLNRIKDTRIRGLKSELRRTRQELDEILENMTAELCPSCEREVLLAWDEDYSLSAFCPYCGQRLMLCSRCDHRCDYDSEKDVCSEM